MPLELKRPYQLRTGDFDRYGRVKPAAVLDVFQDIAGLQAEDMGIGRDRMLAEGVFWAVVRMKYEVIAQPSLHEAVIARTWPYAPSRFTFQRDYTMSDESGKLLIKASSEWTLMDIRTRSLAKVTDHCATDGDYCTDRSFESRVRRVPPFDLDPGAQPVYTVVPRESDVDVNGHVNNARYAAYAFDALNLDAEYQLHTFQIDFKHEVLVGQPLSLHVKREDEKALVAGVNENGDVAFACECVFAR